MRRFRNVVLASLLLSVPTPAFAQIPYAMYKASLSLSVQFQGVDSKGNPVVKVRTLKTNDVINLALGRSLTMKPDKTTEILALAMDDGSPGADSKLVVYNSSSNSFKTVVWTQSNAQIFFNGTEDTSGVGIADVNVQATTLGDPTHNGFGASTLAGGGSGKGNGTSASASASSLSGPLTVTITDPNASPVTINGVVIGAKFKAGGKALGFISPI